MVPDPLNQRVLDPARGLGTVTFAGVRTYLAAARHDASKSVAQVRAEREASGKGFGVTIARRESRRWLSPPEEASVGQLFGRGADALSTYPQYPPIPLFYCLVSHALAHPTLRGATVAQSREPPTKDESRGRW